MPQVKINCIVAAFSPSNVINDVASASNNKVLTTACHLAKRLDASLRVVSVFEPTHAPPWSDVPFPGKTIADRGDIYQALRLGREKAVERLKAEVTQVVESVNGVNIVGTVIQASEAAEALMAEAVANSADLIIVGTTQDSYRFTLNGFSTALSLLATSPKPVLVIPQGATVPFSGTRSCFCVADDLKHAESEVIRYAISLAARLQPCDLRHIHVLEETPIWSHLKNVKRSDAEQACEDELRRRSSHFLHLLNEDSRYDSEIITGSVREALRDRAITLAPDLIAFGRHELFSMRHFRIGKIPASAMLEFKLPVLLVPQSS